MRNWTVLSFDHRNSAAVHFKRYIGRLSIWFLIIAMVGCGGGGGTTASLLTPVSVGIHWGDKAPGPGRLSTALSVRVSIVGAAGDGGDAVFVVNRDAILGSHSVTAKAGINARQGIWELRAEFRSLANGQGDALGTADSDVRIDSRSPIQDPSGHPLTISNTGAVSFVQLLPGQWMQVGAETNLRASAFGGIGEVIALPPSSFQFTTTGQEFLNVDPSGHARALSAGTARVSVALGAARAAEALPVIVLPKVRIRSIPLMVYDMAWDPTSHRIYASVPGSAVPGQGNSIAVIDPTAAVVERYVYVGSEPGRMAITADGRFLNVALNGEKAISRLRLPDLTPDLKFSVAGSMLSTQIIDIALQPGNTHALAVLTNGTIGGQSHSSITLYDDSARRLNSAETSGPDNNQSITFSDDGKTLFATWNGRLVPFTVDNLGVNWNGQMGWPLGVVPYPVRFVGGRIYCSNGLTLDPTDGHTIGMFPVRSSPFGFVLTAYTVDAARGRAYYMMPGDGAAVLQSFDLTSFMARGGLAIPDRISNFSVTGVTNVISWDAGNFALSTSALSGNGSIVLISGMTD